ncbi:MAG: SPFH domain-containing protein [Candidatus Scalindua sp.]|nr:SPFH domain-containing protein [Candidatus Scalindua sp.]
MEKGFNPKGVKKQKFISTKVIFFVIVPIILVAILIIGGRRLSWKEIKGDEVAVIINNITGKITTIDHAGAIVYYPFIQDLYILDKSEQSAPMTSANISAEYPQGNPVILKTRDGGDVSLDLIVQYRLISKMADKVVQNTGFGDVYKEKWIRDYAKTICRYEFGELEIGEFPEAEKRRLKTTEAAEELDRLLNQHGIMMTAINLIDYRYYREYAEKIQERRIADKEVQEQRSRGKAAKENQERVVTEETKKLDVAVSRFRGQLYNMEIDAKAEAAKVKQEGIAYLLKAKFDADAEYERLRKEAEAILAVKEAEAAGILALRNALEGEGGRNLVKLEYAKRLREAKIIGTPVLRAAEEIPQLRIRERERQLRALELMPPPAEEEEKPSLKKEEKPLKEKQKK